MACDDGSTVISADFNKLLRKMDGLAELAKEESVGELARGVSEARDELSGLVERMRWDEEDAMAHDAMADSTRDAAHEPTEP